MVNSLYKINIIRNSIFILLELRTSKSLIHGVGYGYIRRKLSEYAGPYSLFFRALVPLRMKPSESGFSENIAITYTLTKFHVRSLSILSKKCNYIYYRSKQSIYLLLLYLFLFSYQYKLFDNFRHYYTN